MIVAPPYPTGLSGLFISKDDRIFTFSENNNFVQFSLSKLERKGRGSWLQFGGRVSFKKSCRERKLDHFISRASFAFSPALRAAVAYLRTRGSSLWRPSPWWMFGVRARAASPNFMRASSFLRRAFASDASFSRTSSANLSDSPQFSSLAWTSEIRLPPSRIPRSPQRSPPHWSCTTSKFWAIRFRRSEWPRPGCSAASRPLCIRNRVRFGISKGRRPSSSRSPDSIPQWCQNQFSFFTPIERYYFKNWILLQ